MINFHCSRHKGNSPILKDQEVENWADKVLADYKPEHLEKPGKLNATHFIETYLEASVECQDIYYKKDESPILGATAFNDEQLPIFDRERESIHTIAVGARTVILDNSIMDEKNEGLCRFTAFHESGHLFLHPAVYVKNNRNQISLFDETFRRQPLVCCHRASIENGSYRPWREWTEADYLEHQANIFAAEMAMPEATFIPFVSGLIRAKGYKDGYFADPDWLIYEYHLPEVINDIVETYGVSKSAALTNIKKRHLLYEKTPEIELQETDDLPF